METCADCGQQIKAGTAVIANGKHFCNNLCRMLFEKKNIQITSSDTKIKVKLTNKRKLSKAAIISIVFSVSGGIIGANVATRMFTKMRINKELAESANEINKNTPLMLDKETQLLTAIPLDNALQYHYKLINMQLATINMDQFKNYIAKQIPSFACTNPNTKQLIDKSIRLDYVYYDKDTKYVITYSVDKDSCQQRGLN